MIAEKIAEKTIAERKMIATVEPFARPVSSSPVRSGVAAAWPTPI